MSLKIHTSNFNYFNIVIEDNSTLDEITDKLVKFSEFSDSGYHVGVDLSLLKNSENFQLLSNQILKKFEELKFKILFVKSTNSLNSEYDKLVNQEPINFNKQSISDKSIFVFNSTKVIDSTVRSGAEITNDGDVIINGLISHGAEIKSTGNIHVYGECRGKLFAGTNGNESARIYVNNFNAEAVGIANIRHTFEDAIQAKLKNKSVYIYLDDKKRINITPIKI